MRSASLAASALLSRAPPPSSHRLLMPILHRRRLLSSPSSPPSSSSSSSTSGRICPDLRILFFGSDAFSAASLTALVDAQRSGRLPISRIDVACRPAKRAGRGLKTVRPLAIAAAARSHGLAVHEVDSFRDGWTAPPAESALSQAAAINLVVAVSFGLLIPARVIRAAAYGGLNVHPSLLPDFRGAAPIERAVMAGCRESGVSVQTLHPTRFDHGAVLRQEAVPVERYLAQYQQQQRPATDHRSADDAEGMAALRHDMAVRGARLLVEALESGAFLHPLQTVETPATYPSGDPVLATRRAPKITPDDREVDWRACTADEIVARQRAIGPLWNWMGWSGGSGGQGTAAGAKGLHRVKWTGLFRPASYQQQQQQQSSPESAPEGRHRHGYKDRALKVKAKDGSLLSIHRFTPAGSKDTSALDFWKAHGLDDRNVMILPPGSVRDGSQSAEQQSTLAGALDGNEPASPPLFGPGKPVNGSSSSPT